MAMFTLYVIAVKGSMLSDGSLHTSLLLLDCMLDDTRVSQSNKINRYMERKKDKSDIEGERKNMIDVTYQQKEDSMFSMIIIFFFVSMSWMFIMMFWVPTQKEIFNC